MKYLLDTNICIYLIKTRPPQVKAAFEMRRVGDIGISAITLAELQYGVAKSQQQERNQQALEQFVVPLVVVPFDAEAAAMYGQLRGYLERQGTPIGSLDTLIAAHALSLACVLVTNNTREFSRVPELQLENWAEDSSA